MGLKDASTNLGKVKQAKGLHHYKQRTSNLLTLPRFPHTARD